MCSQVLDHQPSANALWMSAGWMVVVGYVPKGAMRELVELAPTAQR